MGFLTGEKGHFIAYVQ